MITGVDYTFISNLVSETVVPLVIKMLEEIWGKTIIDIYERKPDFIELFIAKDEQMRAYQYEHGYILDENGEGSVMFYGRIFPFIRGDARVISWSQPEELRNIAPYTTNISLINVWEYTLVLPGDIKESLFCKLIYNKFLSILEGNNVT